MKPGTDDRCAGHSDENARNAGAPLPTTQNNHQTGKSHETRHPVDLAGGDALYQTVHFLQNIITVGGKTQNLPQLADQNRKSDSVEVSDADRLGKQIGNETEFHKTGQNAKSSREHCQQSG